jgi:hypothetical protein
MWPGLTLQTQHSLSQACPVQKPTCYLSSFFISLGGQATGSPLDPTDDTSGSWEEPESGEGWMGQARTGSRNL